MQHIKNVCCRSQLFSSWWFQPIWNISVKLDHVLLVKTTNLWNHHLGVSFGDKGAIPATTYIRSLGTGKTRATWRTIPNNWMYKLQLCRLCRPHIFLFKLFFNQRPKQRPKHVLLKRDRNNGRTSTRPERPPSLEDHPRLLRLEDSVGNGCFRCRH